MKRKRIAVFLMITLFSISCTGCSSRFDLPFMEHSSLQIGQDMEHALSERKSMSGTLSLDSHFFSVAESDSDMELSICSQTDFVSVFSDVTQEHTEFSVSDMISDNTYSFETYIVNDKIYQKQDEQDWKFTDCAFLPRRLLLSGTTFADDTSELNVSGQTIGSVPVYKITRVVTGSDLEECLSGLGFDKFGSLDVSSSDMTISVYIDKSTYLPVRQTMDLTTTGQPVTFLYDDMSLQADKLSVVFDVESYDMTDAIDLPDTVAVMNFDSKPTGGSVVHTENNDVLSGVNLTSDDNLYSVSFSGMDKLNMASVENDCLVVYDFNGGADSPELSLSFVKPDLDAYSCALSDQRTTLSYYANEENGLDDGYVSDVKTMTVSGYPVYVYVRQYTNPDLEFVSSEYAFYIDLDETHYLSGTLCALSDAGSTIAIDDNFLGQVFDNLHISRT